LNLIFKRAIIWLFNLVEVMGVLRKPFKEEMKLGLCFSVLMRREESKELKMLGLGALKRSTLGIWFISIDGVGKPETNMNVHGLVLLGSCVWRKLVMLTEINPPVLLFGLLTVLFFCDVHQNN
jgi:hypothetical protein